MKKKYTHLEVGKRLKELRKKISQKEFAKKIDVPIASYQRYEYGETLPPEPVLKRIAELCNTTVDEILGRDSWESLRRFIAKEKEEHAVKKEEDKAFWGKVGEKIGGWGIPVPEDIDPKELIKIILSYAKHGINIVELVKRECTGCAAEEHIYHEKLQAILKGKNKKNASAIKENIDAFYDTRNVEIPREGELKKTNAG